MWSADFHQIDGSHDIQKRQMSRRLRLLLVPFSSARTVLPLARTRLPSDSTPGLATGLTVPSDPLIRATTLTAAADGPAVQCHRIGLLPFDEQRSCRDGQGPVSKLFCNKLIVPAPVLVRPAVPTRVALTTRVLCTCSVGNVEGPRARA